MYQLKPDQVIDTLETNNNTKSTNTLQQCYFKNRVMFLRAAKRDSNT